ncbi:superoxide dismutase [Alkaliphilus peptidifermentans]|uniref:Superoxide dismutase n=1 Tax=Alkaliphilus peptidifermentans DSM 18978 TaxID=1120976 RepID=A0A1G5FFL9_9FIRM|nr:superoxide dismutase [Alkaliphilus peptidifermentans]SCY37977.1 superoxide dismutase, Fe-Mn family [Alkaliphilus peptidifermentans DSM 18978]
MTYKLPELNYFYDSLEPYIDKETMEIHHSKHHQGYINNLNAALEGHAKLSDMDIEDLLQYLDQVPTEIYWAVRNNGGGYYNHDIFWNVLSPNGGGEPKGDLLEEINNTFGSFQQFQDSFNKAATTRFGSGWAWLIINSEGKLEITSTPNQDNPIMDGNKVLMGIDVWEHAYYLKYQNKRPDYIQAFWNVIDWDYVNNRYKMYR